MGKTKKVKSSEASLKNRYPRIYELGLEVELEPIAHVPSKMLGLALKKAKIAKKFSELFGIQTRYIAGPYPWDVEAVLERIASGKLTGSQLDWD